MHGIQFEAKCMRHTEKSHRALNLGHQEYGHILKKILGRCVISYQIRRNAEHTLLTFSQDADTHLQQASLLIVAEVVKGTQITSSTQVSIDQRTSGTAFYLSSKSESR